MVKTLKDYLLEGGLKGKQFRCRKFGTIYEIIGVNYELGYPADYINATVLILGEDKGSPSLEKPRIYKGWHFANHIEDLEYTQYFLKGIL